LRGLVEVSEDEVEVEEEEEEYESVVDDEESDDSESDDEESEEDVLPSCPCVFSATPSSCSSSLPDSAALAARDAGPSDAPLASVRFRPLSFGL
jgi:hypothetical protein